jgi:peptidoglycan/LPS O-acetylase OafA/YrhL
MKLDLRRSRVAVVLAALAFYLLFVWRTSFVVGGRRYFVLFEDAMISMRYARNFADGHGFAWNAGEPPIEGFTNFLWTLWMSVAHKIGMSESKISLFIMLSGVALMLGNGLVASQIAARISKSPWVPLLVLAAVLFDYPLVFWTLRGMEVGGLTLIVYTMLYLAIRNEEEFSVARTAAMSLLTAAALLTRSDSIVAVGLIGLFGLITARNRVVFVMIMGAGAGSALFGQLQFRKRHFNGETLPNTYFLKLHGIPLSARVKRGAFVALEVLTMHLAVPLALVFAGVTGLQKRHLRDPAMRRKALFAAIFVAQCGYHTFVGGDAWEWMLYANRYMCVGMPALILLVALVAEDVVALDRAGRERFAKRVSVGLMGIGGVLLGLQAYARLRPEEGIAATIVWSKLAAATGGALFGGGVLLRLSDCQKAIVEGVDALRRRVAVRHAAGFATLFFCALVWLPCHALPLGRWAGQNAAQYTDEARYTRLGLLIAATTPQDLRIAVAAAGATPYFSRRPTEDLLGKNDRHVARLKPRGVFSPGHDKWDYPYSLGERDSQLIVELVDKNEEDEKYIESLGFVTMANEMRLRKTAPVEQRDVLGAVVDDGAALGEALDKVRFVLPEGSKPIDLAVVAGFGAVILGLVTVLLRVRPRDEDLADVVEDPEPSEERDAAIAAAKKGAEAKQIPTLDGMRGIAVLLVLAFHFAWTFPENGALAQRLHDFLWSGWIGVDLFFVLSGYLITRGLVSPSARAIGTRLKMFWMRRVLRIFPLYYAFVIVGTIVSLALGLGWIPSWHYWLYMQNYKLAFDPEVLRWTAHFWSLAIEEQFYFVWPLVAVLVPKRRLVPVILVLVTATVLVRAGLTFKQPWDEHQTIKFVYRATFTRADGLLLGALTAVLQRESAHPVAHAWRRLRFPILVATGLVLAGLYAVCHGLNDYDRRMIVIGYVSLALFFAAAVSMCGDAVVSPRVRAFLESKPLVACGKVSYGMYIFHWVLVVLLVPRLEKMQAPAAGMSSLAQIGLVSGVIVVGILIIYMCAWVSFRFFESPFLKLKGKFHD